MASEDWVSGYQEVKNVIHNEIGVTKEDILEVFRQIARSEIQKLVSENGDFIYESLQAIIHKEMTNAIKNHKYPKVVGNALHYGNGGKGENSFKDYVSGVMKEEIIIEVREKLDITFNIARKE